jgi:hypothetical protein
MFWRLTKKRSLNGWKGRREFSQGENRNPQINDEQWLQRYVFTDLHEIFFGEFPNILAEWLERLVENTGRYRTVAPRNWTPELVRKLNYVRNTTSCAVDFC